MDSFETEGVSLEINIKDLSKLEAFLLMGRCEIYLDRKLSGLMKRNH